MKECPACRSCFSDDYEKCPKDDNQLLASIAGEPVLDGRYLLEQRLGQGGMGVVYRARHIFLKTAHAIKVILPDLVGNDPELVTRFRQEAMAAAAIRHPNVVAVTDFGVAKGIMPFLVMEFVKGQSLQDILAREGRLMPARALEIMEGIAAGVGAAHRHQIVHRDLKPLNIMLQEGVPEREGVKVLDFGLAKIKSGELLGSFIAAKTTGMMGSPFYMAPEQWSDEEPDRRADIYSLGVILYQMLVGDVPFRGTNVPAIMKKHMMTEPPPFPLPRTEVPSAVEAVVRHALEKNPEDRPPTAKALVSELRRAITVSTSTTKIAGPRVTSPLTGNTLIEQPGMVDRFAGTISSDSNIDLPSAERFAAEMAQIEREVALRDAEEEARLRQAEEERRRREAEEPQGREAEEEARQRTEEAARLARGIEEAHRRAEEEARRRAQEEEARRKAEEEARELTEEAARLAREIEAERQRAEEEERRRREAEERGAAAMTESRAASNYAPNLTSPLTHSTKVEPRPVSSSTLIKDNGSLLEVELPGTGQPSRPAFEPSASGLGAEIQKASSPKMFIVAAAMTALLLLVGCIVVWNYWYSGKNTAPGRKAVANTGTKSSRAQSPDLVAIPGGTFRMGREDVTKASEAAYAQWPAHTVSVRAFSIDRTEVTNAEYAEFVRETNHRPPEDWSSDKPPAGKEEWPVSDVSFEDAEAFAEWRSKRDGVTYRLPTEEEWEYAARGGAKDYLYPWGNEWDESRANVDSDTPVPVGSYPTGRSVWGIDDLIGNVWEWTSSKASIYPGNDILKVPPSQQDWIVIRGGSSASMQERAIQMRGGKEFPATVRQWVVPTTRTPSLGFRLVRASS